MSVTVIAGSPNDFMKLSGNQTVLGEKTFLAVEDAAVPIKVYGGATNQYGDLQQFYSDGVLKAGVMLDGMTYTYGGAFIQAAAPTYKSLRVKSLASQTGNLTEWQSSSNTVVAHVSPSGASMFSSVYSTALFVNSGYYSSAVSILPGFASEKGLVVRAASGQTANLVEFQDNAGSIYSKITLNGAFRAMQDGRHSFGGDFIAGTQVAINTNLPANKGLIVRGATSQTANLAELQNSSGSILGGFSSNGNLLINTSTHASGIAGAGTANALPGNPDGYLIVTTTAGQTKKIPFYNN